MDFEPQYVSLTTDRIEICASQAVTDEDDCCTYYLKIENNSDAPIMVLGKDLNITDTQGHHFVTSDHTFKGEILELNPGEYFEFEDMMPTLPGTAVLYGTCRIIIQTVLLLDGGFLFKKLVLMLDKFIFH